MKYLERLQASNEELNAAKAQARADEVEGELRSRIASKGAQITRLENQADGILNQYPLDVDAYVRASNKVEDAKTELANLEGVYNDLFGAAE